jgi:hypothetical protein
MTGSILRWCGALVVAITLVLPLSSAQADPAAQAFIDGIYSQYRGAKSSGVRLDGNAALERYFEPSLVALLVKDGEEAHKKGEVPKLDGDPFVDAQDWDITDVKSIITDAGKDRAQAVVTFRNFRKPKTVKLDLVRVGSGWKIADIVWDEGSLRQLLMSP